MVVYSLELMMQVLLSVSIKASLGIERPALASNVSTICAESFLVDEIGGS